MISWPTVHALSTFALAAAWTPRIHAAALPTNQSSASGTTVDWDPSLNALPFPFSRPGQDNSTFWQVSFTPTSSVASAEDAKPVSTFQETLSGIGSANFIAYQGRFKDIVANAKLELVFDNVRAHEAPVYVPGKEIIYFAGFEGQSQFVIDLKANTLSNYTASPPVPNVNGGTFHNREIVVATNGAPDSAAAIYSINAETGKSKTVVNNYNGLYLNSPNDVVVDKSGNIWWTDPTYGNINGFNPRAPQLPRNLYVFNKTSNLVSVANAGDFQQPNGLVFSPDERTLYVTDTAALPDVGQAPGPRTIYAFDVLNGRFLANKRAFYYADTSIPDGIKVTTNGDVWTQAGQTVDVLDPQGQLLGRIITEKPCANLVFAGPELNDLWLFGDMAVYKVSGLNVKGQPVGWSQ